MSATVAHRHAARSAPRRSGADRRRRSTVRLAMPDLLRQVAGRRRSATWCSRAPARAGSSTRRGCSTSRSTPPPPSDQGMRVERRFERFVENGESPAATTFARRRSDPRHADDHAAEGAPVRRGHRRAAGRRRGRGQLVPDDGLRPGAARPRRNRTIDRSKRAGGAAASIASRSTTIASCCSRRA